jgi:polygalacturonase
MTFSLIWFFCPFLLQTGGTIMQEASTPPEKGVMVDVRSLGAKGDGKTLDTRVIQRAIDSCGQAGGKVLLARGSFLCGTLFMRSNVTLEIAEGATLLGSTDIRDYPSIPAPVPTNADIYHTQSLIAGIDLENVTLMGRGTIDGQGGTFAPRPRPKPERYKDRPNGIRLMRCRNVRVEDLTLRNSAKWMQHYFACEVVSIRGITVDNACNMNNDMIDIDGCRNVTIADCIGDTDDDAITIKSTSDFVTENVTITNCVVGSHCNAVKVGTESCGGFRNIAISNVVVRPPKHDRVIFGVRNGLAGILLTVVDGGILDGVVIDGVRIDGPRVPIFIRLGNRGRIPNPEGQRPGPGIVRNVSISNIMATGADTTGCTIAGLPGHPVEKVVLSNVQITFAGGGTPRGEDAPVPEKPEEYPESSMFGKLPGYGFNLRHVRDVTIRDLMLRTQSLDARPAVWAEDAAGLQIRGLWADAPVAGPLMRLDSCSDVTIRESAPSADADEFLAVQGARSNAIRLQANDLLKVRRAVHAAPGVPPEAIIKTNNLEPESKKPEQSRSVKP